MYEELLDKTVRVQTRTCVVCGEQGEVGAILGQLLEWLKGVPAQDAFPDMEPGQREQLINGTHSVCFDKLFCEDGFEEEEASL